jgi:hypothetical protein
VLIGAVTATGVSWASIPDATGRIWSCYATAGTSHALSVIDRAKTAKCPTGTLPLNWNIGALLMQKTIFFTGPFAGTVASFTVPAGLMCMEATATAYTTGPGLLGVSFAPTASGPPSVTLAIEANEANSHKALVPKTGSPSCLPVSAGTKTYVGSTIAAGNTSDSNDFGSISVRVYSQ